MSEVKVNKISPRSGTEVTLGDSGDTFTIPSGATINNQGTATNFGATGSASWTTTVKTSTFTAVAGEGYFVDTTGGAVTVNLPAGTAGAVVAVKDYAGTFDSNNCTLVQNGSDKIGGSTVNVTLDTEGIAVTLIFIDSTQGWLVTDSGLQSEAPTAQYITATGGTITTVCTNFKVHTFTGPGTFCVSAGGNAAGSNTVDYLVVAGGSAGGYDRGGGGGAGGYRESPGTASGCYSVSPLGASPAVALPVSVQGYPITVGAGGSTSNNPTTPVPNGNNSIFSSITSAGGGAAGNPGGSNVTGSPGGSGGGARDGGGAGGSGNAPPVNPAQGTDGGQAPSNQSGPGGGGGGATQAGFDGSGNPSQPTMGDGGAGATSSINGTPTARGGGGGSGGGGSIPAGGVGGAGGGGNGASQPAGPQQPSAGTANTGGGGGAGNGGPSQCGQAGGSGIVIIRYRFQ
jgi:hypothetical protein